MATGHIKKEMKMKFPENVFPEKGRTVMKKEEIAFNKPSGKNPFGKNSEPESKTPSPHEEEKPEESISPSIEKNLKKIRSLFSNDDTFMFRKFESAGQAPLRCAVCFLDGMCKDSDVSEFFVKPVIEKTFDEPLSEEKLKKEVFYGGDFQTETDFQKAVEGVLAGNSVFFIEGFSLILVADTKGYKTRAPEEPNNEKILNGSREGFCEDLMINLSLLRRRLKTTDLKIQYLTVGEKTNTKVAVCYLQGIADNNLVKGIIEKIQAIQIDGAVCTNYIEELISGNRLSPFKTAGSTERPDAAAAKMLEGKVTVFVDGTPMVMTAPYLYIENFISPDDYYLHYVYSSMMRVLRILCFLISICLPGLFVALLTFHSQMLPTEFMLSLVGAREGVPFPLLVECLGLLGVFEILRETGVRVSSSVGQPISIVGALVLGEAAISAKYVSAPTVIIIAMACLSGLMLQKIKGAILINRILVLFASAVLGLYGFLFAVAGIFFHLLSLKSFGIQYIGYEESKSPRSPRDIFVRLPLWMQKKNSQS